MPKVKLFYKVKQQKFKNPLVKNRMYVTELDMKSAVTSAEFYKEWKAVYDKDSKEEVQLFLLKLNTIVTALLERSHPVCVPYLGKFKLQCRANGVEGRKEAGRLSIRSVKVAFTPTTELKKYFDLSNCILTEDRDSKEGAHKRL